MGYCKKHHVYNPGECEDCQGEQVEDFEAAPDWTPPTGALLQQSLREAREREAERQAEGYETPPWYILDEPGIVPPMMYTRRADPGHMPQGYKEALEAYTRQHSKAPLLAGNWDGDILVCDTHFYLRPGVSKP